MVDLDAELGRLITLFGYAPVLQSIAISAQNTADVYGSDNSRFAVMTKEWAEQARKHFEPTRRRKK